MTPDTRPETSDIADLRDKALGLRESVNGARARLYNQRETMRRLQAELAELKELARTGMVIPPPAAVAPVVKEAAADSARVVAASLKTDAPRQRVSMSKLLPYAVLASFAVMSQWPQRQPATLPAIAAPAHLLRADAVPASTVASDDDRGDEAIALVHEWRVPGDDRPIAERLEQTVELPGSRPAWSVERTGESTYRVSFQPAQAESALEFDVDLDARRVDPSPDTAEMLAPRLTARR